MLSGETLDPDAAHGDDNDVRPYLTLQMTSGNNGPAARLERRPDDAAADAEPAPDTSIPTASPGTDGLEVYGWESSLWSKIRGYLGF